MPQSDSPARISLAITLGDPSGIGPEVAIAAARQFTTGPDDLRLILIGPAGTEADGFSDLIETGAWSTTDGSARAGKLAALAIEEAARLALSGAVNGIVTGPIDKAALHAAGYTHAGHTEMLAALSGAPDVSMLMCAEQTRLGGPLRVVLATTHVRLSDVPRLLTRDLLVRQTRIVEAALRRGWAMDRPRIALCAFNPHASDRGLFGDEEARIYAPAIDELRAGGVAVTGPWPADTVFVRAARGEFDAVVAPYHDVGMAAFKTASFGHGVNVTLGLPFVRTSPDHGTAKDIAGTRRADASSMIEAIRLAARLAARHRTVAGNA
ncbi:MAG: 4-hydroxythreonine-4-phosphate dehydrogenase PdxA [Gemmatimonadetes bacterium]|nr:4-hydroxythreonine-4-phosphate dehydrogenase PdxA [Gemmatimonadota bacterium]